MSFSINVRAAKKADCAAQAEKALRATLEGQQGHTNDREMIYAAVAGAINAVAEKDGFDFVCEAYGSATTERDAEGNYTQINNTSLTLRAYSAPSAIPA